jgi:hypothetical protein
MFGLADRVEGCACWVEPLRWYVSGTAGRALGETLLREFLEAGTPWPSEYDLFASPAGVPTAGGPEVYVHQGTRCRQVWRLRRPRERPASF